MKCLALLKPDAFKRRIERVLLTQLVQEFPVWRVMVINQLDEYILEDHYRDHLQKDFYPRLKKFMLSGPVMSIVVEGEPARLREFVREVRSAWNCEGEQNLIHGSDSADSARREVRLWWPGLEYEESYVGCYSPQSHLSNLTLCTDRDGAHRSLAC